MNDQEIRIAIAEACGWRKAEPPNAPVWWKNGEWVSNVYDLPDYPNDLNAMHEAWLTLNVTQRQRFVVHLALVGGGRYWPTSEMLGATARQRAEAYLRTIGKWKD